MDFGQFRWSERPRRSYNGQGPQLGALGSPTHRFWSLRAVGRHLGPPETRNSETPILVHQNNPLITESTVRAFERPEHDLQEKSNILKTYFLKKSCDQISSISKTKKIDVFFSFLFGFESFIAYSQNGDFVTNP